MPQLLILSDKTWKSQYKEQCLFLGIGLGVVLNCLCHNMEGKLRHVFFLPNRDNLPDRVSPLLLHISASKCGFHECQSLLSPHGSKGWKPPRSFYWIYGERIVLIYLGKLSRSHIQPFLKSWEVISMLMEFLETKVSHGVASKAMFSGWWCHFYNSGTTGNDVTV